MKTQQGIIENLLASFNAPVTFSEVRQGPTVTQFLVMPGYTKQSNGKQQKVKVSKIASYQDDLATALAAKSVRVQPHIPGTHCVGIEVSNSTKTLVPLRNVIESTEYLKVKSRLRFAVGQDAAGNPVVADLGELPHMLVGGTTGSGKTVFLRSIINCLLLQNTPEQLKLILIDPKRVEFTGYRNVRHLAKDVVVEMEEVPTVLSWLTQEMDRRYRMFQEEEVRNIAEYHERVGQLEFIVLVIDELADLMMTAPKETEDSIIRLAQLARATGIHLVVATQYPKKEVVTGRIKANLPCRVSFLVASHVESKVILDEVGAERLEGQGDMLYSSPYEPKSVRVQGCFVSDKETRKLIKHWKR